VHFNGRIREKPDTVEQCREYLHSYTDLNPAVTCSALVLTDTRTGKQVFGTDVAKQYFKPPIPASVVEECLAKGDIMFCAGALMIDERMNYSADYYIAL
jgi:predicted house-cleaning NTP pyrophosphatase (Maf/HAM1 superfamily)